MDVLKINDDDDCVFLFLNTVYTRFISREILDIIRVSDWGVDLWSGQAEFLAEICEHE